MVCRKKAGALVGSDNLKPKKEVKAKEGPKRPLSAYIFFCNDKREEISTEGFKGKELMKEMGRRWKALEEEEKKPYNQASEDAKSQVEKAGGTTKAQQRSKSPGKGKTASSRSLSPPKGKAKAAEESMDGEAKAKRGRKKGGC